MFLEHQISILDTEDWSEEPVNTRRVSTSVKVLAACGKNNANIEEMIADRGFGFHTKVKSVS